MIALALLLLAILPRETVVRETCDCLEVNVFFDENGAEVFQQLIFWEVNGERTDVRAWRLIKHHSQLPVRDWARGDYTVTWQDGEVLREVRSKSVIYSWEQFDKELVARESLAKDLRRELRANKRSK